MADLDNEAEQATTMLAGKTVGQVIRSRGNEVAIEFTDGTRLFADTNDGEIELSITEGIAGPESQADETLNPPSAQLLTPPQNYAVVQLPDRRFPGVVFHGDSLSQPCENLGATMAGDSGELAAVKGELDEILRSYLAVLEGESIEPPFSYRPPA